MRDILGFLEKAAEKTGFDRQVYNLNNVPTDPSNITVIPYFGELKGLFVLSSLLLHRFKEQERPSKYLIMCSWPGFGDLFPYVDEYWSIQSEVHLKKIYPSAIGLDNRNELLGTYFRNLHQYFFEDVIPDSYFKTYYEHGLTDAFWQKFKQVKRFLPTIQASIGLGKEVVKEFAERGGFKVFVYPTFFVNKWHHNRTKVINAPKDFWAALIRRLLKEKFQPVVCKNAFTHDLSSEFSRDCIYFNGNSASKLLTAMRLSSCVLDMFNGTSRFALAARTPFVTVDERQRYMALKEYELDDLCGLYVPKKYIFSSATIIESGGLASWDFDIFNLLMLRLKEFLPTIDKEKLPTTNQSLEVVSYDCVRNKKFKKIGARLLKIPKDD